MNLDNINDDCLLNIFLFLDLKERLGIIRVCKRFKILILNQFICERNLLVTSELEIPSNDRIDCYLNDPQNDLNAINFSYLQNSKISFPNSNFIKFKPTLSHDYSILALSVSNKLNLFQFDSLISKFPNLNSISFNSKKNCQLISSYVLNIVINKCRSLTTINLSDCKEVNSDCLRTISDCKTLENLDLTNSKNFGNNGLRFLLKKCSKLKALYIGYNRKLTGQFFRVCQAKIEYLDLTECTNFTNKGLKALEENLGESLKCLITFPVRTNELLKYFCTKFKNLKKLKLIIASEIDYRILTSSSLRLTSLSLNGRVVELTDDLFTRLMSNFKEIKEFEFSPNTQTTSIYRPILDLSRYWPNLKNLRLNNINLEPNQNKLVLNSLLGFNCLNSVSIDLAAINENEVVLFLKNFFKIHRKLEFLNLEYFQEEQKNKFTLFSMKTELNLIEKLGFLVRINQLKLNRQMPYVYLTKIFIKKNFI